MKEIATREIKFRAWNKKEKIMCYDNEDDSSDYWDGTQGSDVGMVNRILRDDFDKYDFMQCTGLRDKNNVMIWEGDRIKFNNEYMEDEATVVRYQTGGRGLEGCETFLHELFSWKDQALKGERKTLDVEVVGNVYEGTFNSSFIQND